MQWTAIARKMVTTGAWADALKQLSGDGSVYIAGCCGEPTGCLDALDAEPDIAAGRMFTGVWIPGVNTRDVTRQGGRSACVSFVTPALQDAVAELRAQILPMHYSATSRWLRNSAGLSGAVFQVGPPRDGTVGLGVSADFTPAAIAAGVPLFAQINPAMPDVVNGPRVPVERFAAMIEAESPLIEHDAGPLDEAYETLGRHVARLVRDGDTVQFGLGKLQNAVLGALADHQDLSLNGGMISPAFLARLQAGTIKRAITGVALGDRDFYDQVSRDPRITFDPVSDTHDGKNLAGIASFVSVNSILEVDLFGQGNGEFIAGKQITGHGGLVDFIRGAAQSDGGRSILALPATMRGGSQSRIVPCLSAGIPVTVTRSDVDWIVTEFGGAHLRHATVDQRADRLIAIAAPQFRDALANAWDAARCRETTR